jgi:hypothetical protein
MPARFLYLECNGSPTRWDGTRYFEYLAGIRSDLPHDLQSLTDEARYKLPSTSILSLWRSDVIRFEAAADRILICAVNDYGTRRFEFEYKGIRKFLTTSVSLYSLPSIVVQELVKLPRGVLRHTFSDMRGGFTTIYASSIAFRDNVIQ